MELKVTRRMLTTNFIEKGEYRAKKNKIIEVELPGENMYKDTIGQLDTIGMSTTHNVEIINRYSQKGNTIDFTQADR